MSSFSFCMFIQTNSQKLRVDQNILVGLHRSGLGTPKFSYLKNGQWKYGINWFKLVKIHDGYFEFMIWAGFLNADDDCNNIWLDWYASVWLLCQGSAGIVLVSLVVNFSSFTVIYRNIVLLHMKYWSLEVEW